MERDRTRISLRVRHPSQAAAELCRALPFAPDLAGPDLGRRRSAHESRGRAAARALPTELGRGGAENMGREEIRGLLNRMTKGRPMVVVSTNARWTLNALSGGYCREVTRQGALTEQAIEGPYRTLMEGIESLAALTKSITLRDDDSINYAYTPQGRRYISSRVVQ